MSGNAHQRRVKRRALRRRYGVLPPFRGPREGGPRCPWCGGTEAEHHYHSRWGDPEYGCLDEQAVEWPENGALLGIR